MSLNTSMAFQSLTLARRQLRRIPAVVLMWRLLKKFVRFAPYFALRLAGWMAYPFLGGRAPLRGYHASTSAYVRGGRGRLLDFEPQSSSDASIFSDPFQPETFVAVIPRARTVYDSGAIISPDHRLLADVSWAGRGLYSEPQLNPVMRSLRLPAIERIHGRVAVINAIKSDNYYHWMFDVLPRLGILKRGGVTPDYYIIGTAAQFQMDSLMAIGVPPDRLLNPSASTHIEADELIVPSLCGPVFTMSPQRQACTYLRSVFLKGKNLRKPHRAIYITRSDAGNRRVINEAEIREEVTNHGFEVVSLTNLPFLEQVALFAEARIVVGPHGAGFTNAVFCQTGTILIEFLPMNWRVDCFERLSRLVEMKYHSIVCPEPETRSQIDNFDHTVDRSELRGLLKQYS